MCLDHSEATGRITFAGLFVFCFNETEQCEVGILRHETHHPQLIILEIGPDNIPRAREHNFNLNNDLTIEAIHPLKGGAKPYLQPGFNRPKNDGDPEDFKWLTDLEGEEFHDCRLDIKLQRAGERPEALRSLLYINHGDFYSYLKSTELYVRVPYQKPSPEVFLGKTSHIVGVDISCSDEGRSGVLLKDKTTGDELFLSKFRDEDDEILRYEIIFNNLCLTPTSVSESDFVLYYQLLSAPDNVMFDLRKAVKQSERYPSGKSIVGTGLILDGRPIVCDPIYLSKTQSLSPFA
jgi:hypothetical protein